MTGVRLLAERAQQKMPEFIAPLPGVWLGTACHQTGYKGRVAIAELWTPSDDDIMLINQGAPLDQVQRSAEKSTLRMAEDVIAKLRQGRTTIEELIRALPNSTLRQLRFMGI